MYLPYIVPYYIISPVLPLFREEFLTMPKLDFAERYRAIPFEVSCTSRTMHAHDFAGNFEILARIAIISRNLISNRVYRIIEILMFDANVRLYIFKQSYFISMRMQEHASGMQKFPDSRTNGSSDGRGVERRRK